MRRICGSIRDRIVVENQIGKADPQQDQRTNQESKCYQSSPDSDQLCKIEASVVVKNTVVIDYQRFWWIRKNDLLKRSGRPTDDRICPQCRLRTVRNRRRDDRL